MNEPGRHAALAARAAAAAALLLAACSGPAAPTSAAHAQPTASPGAAGGRIIREQVLGVAASGQLFVIDPHTGVKTTGVGFDTARATGEEISVTGDQSTIYYEQPLGCTDQISSIPAIGGKGPTAIAAGRLPAVSPDGSMLAYTRQPRQCAQGGLPNLLVVRNLKTGVERTYPVAPQLAQTGLIYPIDHLSWAADGHRLLLSLEAPEDNMGWALAVLDTRSGRYYRTDVPGDQVPVAAGGGRSYYREGVFMPDGSLFVNLVCCEGITPGGPRVASTLLSEVSASGTLVHQVATGFTDRDHTSLAVNQTGSELLYLSGTDLYISDGGQRPRLVTGGLTAATWIDI